MIGSFLSGYSIKQVVICFLICVSGICYTAEKMPDANKKAMRWRDISGQKQLPALDKVPSSSLIKDWQGQTLVIFSDTPSIELRIDPSASGSYQLKLCHLSGKNFPALKLYLNGKSIGETTPGKSSELKPEISSFDTGMIYGSGNMLRIDTASPGDIGLLYIDWQLKSYEPVQADLWSVTTFPEVSFPAKTKLEEKKANGFPADLKWKKLSGKNQEIDLSQYGDKGTVCAVTHLFKATSFNGYGFRLSCPGPAELWVGGQKLITIGKEGGTDDKIAPWHKMNWAFSRIEVKLPAGKNAKFKLECSPLAGGKFYADVPPEFDQTVHVDDWPRAEISNGLIKATVAIPDTQKGFYRGARFEQAGIITDLKYKGHSYFAVFAEKRSPIAPDHAAGPAEEFFEPVGYQEAKPGETFMKVGVGLYEKPYEKSFFFGAPYWKEKVFDWKTEVDGNKAVFTQEGSSPNGYAYKYTKKIILPEGKAELLIEHELVNTGSKRLVTNQYSHNFIRIDNHLTSADYRIDFGFRPEWQKKLPDNVKHKGNSIWGHDKTFFGPLNAPKNEKQNLVTVTHEPSGKGVKISGDFTPFRFWMFWATNAVCPEPFIHIDLAPGEKMSWTRKYEFF